MKKLFLLCILGMLSLNLTKAQSTKTEKEHQIVLNALMNKETELSSYERSTLGLGSEAYVNTYPNSADAHLYRGRALKSLNMQGEALAAFNKSIELNPKQIDAYAYKADILYGTAAYYNSNKERFNENQKAQMFNAIKDGIISAEMAIKYSDNNKDSCLYMYKKGEFFYLTEQYNLASETFTKLIQISRSSDDKGRNYKHYAYSRLADTKYAQKDYNYAIDCAKKAIEIHSNLFDPYTTLSLIYYWAQENDNLALPYLTKGFEVDTEGRWSRGFYQGLSEILASRQDFDQLLRYSLIMQRRDPNYDMAFVYAGDIYLRRGNNTDGIEMFKKAARLGHPHAQQTLRNNGISW